MTNNTLQRNINGHRIGFLAVLCLFGLVLFAASRPARKPRQKVDERVYLIHADVLKYDFFGPEPGAQIVTGKVQFSHKGSKLWCDSAYFYEASNSVKAFGHVRFKQGDTLSLTCDRADYDGQELVMHARMNVVLKHNKQTLYTDSLDYDRLYEFAYFFDGGRLVDGNDKLSSDWGEYSTKTREAVFYYDVRMRSPERLIETDTLHYDTRTSLAHITGKSKITSNQGIIYTDDGFFDSKQDKARLYNRSTVINEGKTITGDSLFFDDNTGVGEGFGNVVYIDTQNKNELRCGHLNYNKLTGYGYATIDALMKDFSQEDTLYLHGDSLKLYTYNINTDSVYRVVHCFDKVRAYRTDMQAVCDSLVFNSKDSCMTMYRDPIVWNAGRQMLGEKIMVFMNDSTIREAHVIGQAFSIEQLPDSIHYNQVSSTNMFSYFVDGNPRRSDAVGNVRAIYYPVDDKDTTLIGLNYTETDTMRMYMSDQRKMERIWMPKATGTLYPMTQIPPSKLKLTGFAWFDNIRPTGPEDVFVWRGKPAGTELRNVERVAMPLQKLDDDKKGNEAVGDDKQENGAVDDDKKDNMPADEDKKHEPADEDKNEELVVKEENS